MPIVNKGLEPGYRILNYSNKTTKQISKDKLNPDSIPNMIPAEYLKEWQKDDPDPYYKVQAIEYPIIANKLNYQESFFKSFISKLNERAIPGSKNGHSIFWGERPDTDLIMVGAKIESNGDGTGIVYFKNYIPPTGGNGSNEIFIRENKTDMVHYSLVTYPKEIIEIDEDGNEIINIVESVKGERNDAVEFGLGAMKQITNNENETFKIALQDYIENAKKHGLDDLSEIATEMMNHISNIGGEKLSKKDETLKELTVLKANAEITLPEIAKALNLENQLITEKHINALKLAEGIEALGIEDPIALIKNMQAKIKADSEAVINARLDKEFGSNPDKDGKENFLRIHAGEKIKNMSGDDLEIKINAIKDDPISKKLAAEAADYSNDINNIAIVETKKNKQETTEKIGGYSVYKL